MQETDQELEEQYCRWVEDYQGLIFRVVHASATLPEDKNDLFQEILLQLWRSMPSFEGRCKETTWMYRVALNTARAWKRSEKRRRERHEEIISFSALQEQAANEPNPLLETLYEAIRQMPAAEASLLLLHLDGLSYQDIAEVIGVSEGCVGVRLSRARKQLIAKMKGELNGI
ncbi:MAG: RNA polymerase sigma factor [Verrucomicrobiales bacterium]|nr:RNA polymerase sigma factor [Verrucomicrobiales bacterium]